MSFKSELQEEASRQLARQKIDASEIERKSSRSDEDWKNVKNLIAYAIKDSIKDCQIIEKHYNYWICISQYSNLFDFGKDEYQIYPADIARFCKEEKIKITYSVETSFGHYKTYRHLPPKSDYLNIYYNIRVS